MKTYLAKTPLVFQNIFGAFTWKIATDKKEIYLTFDDGPIPEITPWVLQTLGEFDARATFFCVGENIAKYPDIYREILNENHAVGNHTFNHLNGWKTSSNKYLNSVLKTEEFLNSEINKKKKEVRSKKKEEILKYQLTTGKKQASIKLFRPPYGRIRPKQSKLLIEKGYRIVMWDVLSGDFDKDLSAEKCLLNVIKNTKKGSIIVFHDSEKASENLYYTLPRTLEYFSKKGYVFKSL